MGDFIDVRNFRSLCRRISAFDAALSGKGHIHFACAQRLDNGNALVLELVPDRARRRCKTKVKAYLVTVDFQILDKIQFHDILMQIGILNRPQGI